MINLHYLCIILLLSPLIGAIILGVGCKLLPHKLIAAISILCIVISTLITTYFLWGFFAQNFKIIDTTWYVFATSGNIVLKFGFLLDQLNIIMLTLVALLSLIIQIYSINYMQQDVGYGRFFSYISFFTFSMLTLVIANNFLQLFFGWELVGISSYLLINFWFKKELPNLAAFKAFVINRIGDCSLLLGITAIFVWSGSLDYATVFNNLPASNQIINIICGLLFVGAMAKSAQIPLHVWLPDAMEGPTPVSALIHSATMVTAGVFMLARMSPIFERSEYWLNIILLVGGVTTLLMGILATIENDIKKIIAYSTISQLGLMMVAMGASGYAIGIFHLINHAFFKSLLFLGTGSILLFINRSNIHELPLGLKKHLPITYWCMLIASLAASGVPGFSGFFSKYLIVKTVQLSCLPCATKVYYLLLATTAITSFYSFRLFFIIFHKNTKITEDPANTLYNQSKIINSSIIILAIFSVILGVALVGPVINNKLFATSIIVVPEQSLVNMFLYGFISKSGQCCFLGIIIAFIFYVNNPILRDIIVEKTKKNFLFLYKILKYKYFFDQLNSIITICFKFCCKFLYKVIDKLFIDNLLIGGTTSVIINFAKNIQKLQTGYLYNYIFLMLTGVLIVTVWLILIIY